MRYDRKIKYLDYCENGERIRGSGFLKTEIFEDNFKIELTVKGVRCAREFAGDVILCGNGREAVLGKIQLEDGQGEFRHTCHMSAENGSMIGSTGIDCDELAGIKIPLGEEREIICMWDTAPISAKPPAEASSRSAAKHQEKNRKKEARDSIPRPEQTAPRQEEKMQERREAEEISPEQTEPHRKGKAEERGEAEEISLEQTEPRRKGKAEERGEAEEISLEQTTPRRKGKAEERRKAEEISLEQTEPRRKGKAEELREAEKTQPEQSPLRNLQEQQSEAVPLLENKWLQLCAIYPHVRPFRDQREYLSIGPEDFVLFSSESYKAASNSFMLHGYYNYRHLILTREERRGEILYYVGVPGNYYEREKQVAIMFGFESFECAQEPAQSSDFGYYMMKVQL